LSSLVLLREIIRMLSTLTRDGDIATEPLSLSHARGGESLPCCEKHHNAIVV